MKLILIRVIYFFVVVILTNIIHKLIDEKRTLSGFVLYNKNSEKYSFINEELFTEEINDLLEMMQSDNYIEEFKLFKGLSVKLEEKYLQNLLSIDKGNNYSNILKDEIKKIFIK